MYVRSSKQVYQNSPPIPSNQITLNLLHVEDLTQSSQIVDYRFNKVDLDFISCESYVVLTKTTLLSTVQMV